MAILEVWRSRLLPEEFCYWRKVRPSSRDKSEWFYPPHMESPGDMAAILQKLREKHGAPQIEVRQGSNGIIIRHTFDCRMLTIKPQV